MPAGEATAEPELPTIEPTRWDTHWYKPGPSPASQPAAAPAQTPPGPTAYGPPSYGQGGYGPSGPGGQGGQGGHGYGPASYAQGSPGPGPAGQGPYGQPPYQPPPHVPGTIGTPPLRRGQTAILAILLVVLLLAVGGGAYVLVSRFTGHKTAASPSGSPTLSAPATSTGGATTPASSPAAGPTGSPSPRVSVAAGVAGNPAEPGIAAFLDRYFAAINSHDYAAFSGLLDSREQSVNTPSTFNAGYASTNDSAETLTGIAGTGGGNDPDATSSHRGGHTLSVRWKGQVIGTFTALADYCCCPGG